MGWGNRSHSFFLSAVAAGELPVFSKHSLNALESYNNKKFKSHKSRRRKGSGEVGGG